MRYGAGAQSEDRTAGVQTEGCGRAGIRRSTAQTGSGGSGVPVAAHGEQANDEEVVGVSRGLRRSRGIGIPFRCPRSATSEVEPLRPRSPCATIGQILFRWLFTPPYPTTLLLWCRSCVRINDTIGIPRQKAEAT